MKNKDILKETAAEFKQDGDAFVHYEMRGGRNGELMISGDLLAVLHAAACVIHRISVVTHTTMSDTMKVMIDMENRPDGLMGVHRDLQKSRAKTKFIEGQDWQKDWEEQKTKEITREANQNNTFLVAANAALQAQNIALNNQMVDVKKSRDDLRKEKNREIDRLNKEILDLEHRLKEMEEKNTFGGDHEAGMHGKGNRR